MRPSSATAIDASLAMGERIKQQAQLVGLNQRELAEKLGVSRETVSNWVRGRQSVSWSHVDALAELLDCSVCWLRDGDEAIASRAPAPTGPSVRRLAEEVSAIRNALFHPADDEAGAFLVRMLYSIDERLGRIEAQLDAMPDDATRTGIAVTRATKAAVSAQVGADDPETAAARSTRGGAGAKRAGARRARGGGSGGSA